MHGELIAQKVLSRIKPSEKEKQQLEEAGRKLLSEIEAEVKKFDPRLKAKLLGSASRDTWLRYEKDLDVFVLFPIGYEKIQLERIVTNVGKKILRSPQKRYAEHPYIRGSFDGFEVELVPCYEVASPANLISAVDRTPFHHDFVTKNISGRQDEVRLLKQFLKGISCYGAEAKVEGISGYLCELLVIKYGSFESVLRAAKDWRSGQAIRVGEELSPSEIPKLQEKFQHPALIFLDPVDANRNVASALSAEKLFTFAYAAREYLRAPSARFFFPRERKAGRAELLKKFRARGTELVAVVFEKPDAVEDILYPQLRKFLETLKTLLRDFRIVGVEFFTAQKIYILVELERIKISNAVLHFGPEVNSGEDEERFLEKYARYRGKLTEPFIRGQRWCVFLRRRHSDAGRLLEEFLSQKNLDSRGVPSRVAKSLKKGFKIKTNRKAFVEEFLPQLQEYLDPRFPWER